MECLTLMFNSVKADHEKVAAEMKKKEASKELPEADLPVTDEVPQKKE